MQRRCAGSGGNSMMVRYTFAGTIFFNGMVGAVLLTLPVFGWFVIFSPASMQEGMWAFFFVPVGAIGWFLGTLAGTWLAFKYTEPPFFGAWFQAIALIVLGTMCLGPIIGLENALCLEQLYGVFHR